MLPSILMEDLGNILAELNMAEVHSGTRRRFGMGLSGGSLLIEVKHGRPTYFFREQV